MELSYVWQKPYINSVACKSKKRRWQICQSTVLVIWIHILQRDLNLTIINRKFHINRFHRSDRKRVLISDRLATIYLFNLFN